MTDKKGWRVLGPDFNRIADVLPTDGQPDARMGARAVLEAECTAWTPLPSAADLLAQ